eukprot:419552-Pleurochrysis_carterae.AAC.1
MLRPAEKQPAQHGRPQVKGVEAPERKRYKLLILSVCFRNFCTSSRQMNVLFIKYTSNREFRFFMWSSRFASSQTIAYAHFKRCLLDPKLHDGGVIGGKEGASAVTQPMRPAAPTDVLLGYGELSLADALHRQGTSELSISLYLPADELISRSSLPFQMAALLNGSSDSEQPSPCKPNATVADVRRLLSRQLRATRISVGDLALNLTSFGVRKDASTVPAAERRATDGRGVPTAAQS